MATQAEIDELFRQTLEGDYDDEEDEGGPWEAVSKLQAIASREVFDRAVQWCRNKQPAKRRRGVDILAQLGKTEDHPDVVFAAESYAVIASVLEDELDLQVIDSCLVAFGHLGNPAAVPLILEHRANSDPDVRFAVAFALSCFADDPAAIRVLIRNARQQGRTVIAGIEMFVEQAVHQFEIWTGETAPRPAMQKAATEALELKL